jgi:hypothetical protein
MREFGVQSSVELKIRDLKSTPKFCSELPAISEGFALFFVIRAALNDSLRLGQAATLFLLLSDVLPPRQTACVYHCFLRPAAR